jgi:hypothetical protein
MPLFQYFGWVGSCLLAALFAANWCFSSPIGPAPASDVPLNQRINIRIHTEHEWPERAVLDSTSSMLVPEAKSNTETEIDGREMPAQEERQPLDAFAQMPAMPVKLCFRPTCSGGQPSERKASPLEKGAPSQSRARAKDLLSPIRFTGRQEEADAFACETGQFAAQFLRTLAHQSPHQHREQNKIHENLRRGEASFRAKWSLGAARKCVGGIVQDMGNGSGSPIPPGFVDMATERGESVCLGYRGARDADCLLDESLYDLDTETSELVLRRTSLGLKSFEIRQSVDNAAYDRLEQCLLSLEVGIDGRFARRRRLGDLVEARALITSLEEHPLGRIEDSRFHIARQVFGRSSETRPFQIVVLAHH